MQVPPGRASNKQTYHECSRMDTPRTQLVLLPGLEGSGYLFDGLLTELGSSFEAQVLRYPSTAGTYDELLPLVEPIVTQSRPCFVLAESFSTPLAVRLCAAAPAGIQGLILCNGFVSNPLAAFESLMATAIAPWVLHVPLTDFTARTWLVGPDASAGLVSAVQQAIGPVPASVLWARLNAVFHCDAREALARLDIPLLYIHATRDRLIGSAGLREIQRIRPDIPVEHVDGPHLLLQSQPKRCAEIISRCVERIQRMTAPIA